MMIHTNNFILHFYKITFLILARTIHIREKNRAEQFRQIRETNYQLEWAEAYELIEIREEDREISITGERLLGGERLGI